MTEDQFVLNRDGPKRFDASAIEAELRSMWKSSAGEPEARPGAIYRASMCNLVVTTDPERHGRITQVLTEVTRRHPARLFLVEVAPNGGGAHQLSAEVGALCHLRPGGGYVCSERILLRGEASLGRLVPSAVRALLIGNLPTILLDLLADRREEWVDELAALSNLVLEDSGLADQEPLQRAVWKRIERDELDRVRDLAWARLTPWREILADLFEQERLARILAGAGEVIVEFRGSPPPSCVPLFVGWLASRLQWKPTQRDAESYAFQSPTGEVVVRTKMAAGEGDRGIPAVRFRSERPSPIDLTIRHPGRDAAASVEIRGAFELDREVPYPYRDFASCIVGEIHRHEPNPLLREAARLALGWGETAGRVA